MPAAKDFYVAIELGSSKITGIAAQKKVDGSITVLAIATEEAATLIRKGMVYNIDKTNQCIRNIIQKLQNTLQTEITHVHVGIGGQGIRSLVNTITQDMDEATVISHAIIDQMRDNNRTTRYPGQTILDDAPQEYKVDSQYQLDPVGIECNRIQGRFLNIVWRDAYCRNLYKCFEQAGMPQPRYYLASMALADNILTDIERRTGCILADLGAGTTTVSIYYKNLLRHTVTIPLGSANITKDITSFHIDDLEAEKVKLAYASAYTNASEVDPEKPISIDNQRTIPQREFISLVEARTEEIIRNVMAQVPKDLTDKLGGGIILTGGGANMKNIELAFRNYSGIEKIRVAKNINISINCAKGVNIDNNGTLCTALALIMKADQLSSGRPMSEVNTLFPEQETDTPAITNPRINEQKQPGQIPTGRERELAEEAARQKAAEEEARRIAEEEARKAEEERIRRENSFGNKLAKKFKSLTKKFLEEEE